MKENNGSMINDLTQGSVMKQLLLFSVPFMLSNLLQTTYNLVDMLVVGQFVGSAGLSAVSIGGDMMNFFAFFGMGFASAGQIIIAQQVGAGERRRINNTIGTLFTILAGVSVLVMVLCTVNAEWLLGLLNTPAEAMEQAKQYTITCYLGMFFIYGYNAVSAILRGMGDSRRPFYFIAVAASLNVVLDLLFVVVFGMGAFGTALATVIGQAVSFVVSAIYLYRRRGGFGFDFKPASFKPDRFAVTNLVRLGIPLAIQHSAISISMMFVNSYINAYGVVASAVTGVGNKLCGVASIVTMALSNASSAMGGQNFGAGKMDRVKKIVGICLLLGMIFCAALAVCMLITPRGMFAIFNKDPDVLQLAATYTLTGVLSFLGFGLRSPFMGFINGIGHSSLSLFIGLMDGIVCRIGLSLLLGLSMGMGIQGFWLGGALAGFVPFIIGGLYFISGRWEKRQRMC